MIDPTTITISAVFGGLAKPLISLIIRVLEKYFTDDPLSKTAKKLLSLYVCILIGAIIVIGEGYTGGPVTMQTTIFNLATVIATAQAVHGYTR